MRRGKLASPLRFLAWHVAAGFALAAFFVAALFVFDRGNLGDLLWRVGGIGAVARLWGGCGLTFGAALFASGIMSAGGGGGRRRAVRGVPLPAPSLVVRRSRLR